MDVLRADTDRVDVEPDVAGGEVLAARAVPGEAPTLTIER